MIGPLVADTGGLLKALVRTPDNRRSFRALEFGAKFKELDLGGRDSIVGAFYYPARFARAILPSYATHLQ